MKAIQFIAITAIIVSGATFADSARIKNTGNNHYYQRFDKTRGWYDAKAFCDQQGGYLATITSASEQNFIWTNLGNTSQTDGMWLGASDEKQEGLWAWSTREAWNYTNWQVDAPDNAGSYGQHYLMMYTGTNWSSPSPASFWGDMSSLNNFAGAGNNAAHTVSTLCEWNTLPDVYGQISLIKNGVKGANVTLKQASQPDKTVKADNSGKYQLKRNDKTIPATLEITLPATP